MSLLAAVQEQLSTVDQLLAELDRAAAEDPRPSVLANIRALEKERRILHAEFARAATLARLDVYRYSILNTEQATLTGLTEAWRDFQHMLSVVFDSLRSGGIAPKKKPKTKEPAVDSLQLGFGYSFSGSVGVALTLPNDRNTLWASEHIERATDAIIEMSKAYNDQSKVTALARRLGPAPVEAMYRWVDTHVAHGYGVRIEWRRDETTSREVLVQLEQFQSLRAEISRTTFETRMTVTGWLEAVDTTDKTFRLRGDDNQVISGEYEDVITEEHQARLPARYTADILKVTRVVAVGGETKDERFMLNGLEPM